MHVPASVLAELIIVIQMPAKAQLQLLTVLQVRSLPGSLQLAIRVGNLALVSALVSKHFHAKKARQMSPQVQLQLLTGLQVLGLSLDLLVSEVECLEACKFCHHKSGKLSTLASSQL